MTPKVFIDGSEGTTGLRIFERFEGRKDIELITIDHQLRKNPEAVAEKINSSDITFLCLPDEAAKEAVELCSNPNVTILDTSTAHRTSPGWVYGLPELTQAQKGKIAASKRIAVPGCHATGFISLAAPLVNSGIIRSEAVLCATSISGYSGAGKKAIAQYSDISDSPLLEAPRQYALSQQHKHLKEMKLCSGLDNEPVFMPYICNYYSGMEVSIPLYGGLLKNGTRIQNIIEVYKEAYEGSPFYELAEADDSLITGNFISACQMSGRDSIKLLVHGCEERIVVTALFDNLGKGASGAAIQCMNINLGFDETTGLNL